MNKPESDKQNQQKCSKCGRIVGCDYHGRKHKCKCNREGWEMNHHLTLEEKIKLLEDTTSLKAIDSEEMAVILDCHSFDELEQISEAIKIISKGHNH